MDRHVGDPHMLKGILAFAGLALSGACWGDVVVLSAEPLAVGGRSEFAPGDRITDVILPDTSKLRIDSVLDWRRVEIEHLPSEPVVVHGMRGTQPLRATLAEGQVSFTFAAATSPGPHPPVPFDAAADIEAAIRVGNWDIGEKTYLAAIDAVSQKSAEDCAAIHLLGFRLALGRAEPDLASERLHRGIDVVAGSNGPLEATLLEQASALANERRDFDAARSFLDRARAIQIKSAPDSIALGRTLAALAEAERRSEQFDVAAATVEQAILVLSKRCATCKHMGIALGIQARILAGLDRRSEAFASASRAIEILRAVDGNSVDTARTLVAYSARARVIGKFSEANQAIADVFRIYESTPDSDYETGRALLERGTLLWIDDRNAEAKTDWDKTLAIFRKVAPGGREEAMIRNNLGAMASEAGDLTSARAQLHQALAIEKRLNPVGLAIAKVHYNLGNLETSAGAFDSAAAHFRQAIALEEAVNPDGISLGTTLISLASLDIKLQRMDEAAKSFDRAARIYESLPEDCFCLVTLYRDLGRFELSRGRPEQSLKHFRRAEKLSVKLGTDVDRANNDQGLGDASMALGRVREAARLFRSAVKTRTRFLPESPELAESHYALGLAERTLGNAAAARENFCTAADILDVAGAKAGESALAESLFRSQFSDVYRACMESRLKEGDVEAAFVTVERARARGFLNAIEQRELDWHLRAPATLMTRWNANTHALDEAQAKRSEPELSESERAELVSELEKLHAIEGELKASINAVAPSLARLLFPSLESAVTRSRAPAGDILLSFTVGPERTTVFRVDEHEIRTFEVTVTAAELQARVNALRERIARPLVSELPALLNASAELYDLLVAPADLPDDGTKRVLISPDGPLYQLPFAALWDRHAKRYLIEQHPLAVTDSLRSVQVLRNGSARSGNALVAIADPERISEGASSDRPLPDALFHLQPLPAARREIEAISRLGWDGTLLLTGSHASEMEVEHASADAGTLHFATHTLFDPDRPLDSALVLSPGEDRSRTNEDGLLQVWEIFERYRLNASLVVLSACDTALGQEYKGEGLVGFARAFQFAGADAVLASLWKVEDTATSVLMQEFYAQRSGNDPRALQQAVIRMIHAPVASSPSDIVVRGVGGLAPRGSEQAAMSHPFYWAAFQIYGAPR